MEKKHELKNPFPGQVLRRVYNWGDSSSEGTIEEVRPTEESIEDADIVTSEISHIYGGAEAHKVVLDIDFPVKVVDSSTPGHHHLYIDKPITWEQYVKIMDALVEAGIVEEGFLGASIARGFTGVRLPWKRKQAIEDPRCARCHKTPEEIFEYVSMGKIEGLTATEFVLQEEGTLNRTNNRFWCTECYIALGQPTGKAN